MFGIYQFEISQKDHSLGRSRDLDSSW